MNIHGIPFVITDWAEVPQTGDGRSFVLRPGMGYQVADHAEPHRSSTVAGALLFIVD
jgi:hypothetical protein